MYEYVWICMNINQMEYILYIYILIHTNHPWMGHFTRAERHEIVGSLEHPGTCLLSRSWVYAWTCCKTTALDGAMIMCRTYPFLVKLPWGSWGCCGPTVATCRPSKGCWILVSKNGVPKKWRVHNGASDSNGWFTGTPILGNHWSWHHKRFNSCHQSSPAPGIPALCGQFEVCLSVVVPCFSNFNADK